MNALAVCVVCGRTFPTWKAWLRKNQRPHCSYKCNGMERARTLVANRCDWTGRMRPGRYGASNPAWKGGVTYRRKHGLYGKIKYVRCPPEFLSMARADGYVMEHRLVMAQWVGRPLARMEVVHHEDHNPTRNERGNLTLWPSNRSHKLWEHGRDVTGAACR